MKNKEQHKLENDLEYLKRFSEDIEILKSSLVVRDASKTYDDAYNEIIKHVSTWCQKESLRITELNEQAGELLKDFSNQILKGIMDIRENNSNRQIKNKAQIDLASNILQTTLKRRQALNNELSNLSIDDTIKPDEKSSKVHKPKKQKTK